MKNSQGLINSAIAVSVIALSGIAYAQTPKQNPNAQLSPAQLQILKATKLRIAVPTYIPAGFQLDEIQVNAQRNSRVGGLSNLIIYRKYDRDKQDFCFAIEATNGGIGDIPRGEKSVPVNNATFGKTTLELGKYGRAKTPTLLSSWLGQESGPFYRFTGSDVSAILSHCSNISPQEAVKVTESIRYIAP